MIGRSVFFQISVSAAAAVLLFWQSACGAGTAAASVYQVTVRQIDLSKDGGTSWTTIGASSAAFDIASAAVGSSVGAYLTGAAIADGDYNALRVTISNVITVRGTALDTSNGRTYCTDSDGSSENSVTHPATCPAAPEPQAITVLAAPPGGFPAGVTLDAGAGVIRIVNTAFRLSVVNGQGRSYRIDFDVSAGVGVLNNGSGAMYPGAPNVTITQV